MLHVKFIKTINGVVIIMRNLADEIVHQFRLTSKDTINITTRIFFVWCIVHRLNLGGIVYYGQLYFIPFCMKIILHDI